MDVLVQRLVANPHDQEALAYAHQAGTTEPQAYAELLEQVGQNTQDPAFASHWLSESANVWAVALGDAHRAAQLLMMAVERDPGSQVAAMRLADLYRERGEIKSLVALLERRSKALSPYAAQGPEVAQAVGAIHEELGRLWSQPPLSQPRKGIENFRRAIEVDPTNVNAIYGAREMYKQAQQYVDAIQLFDMEQALVSDPERKVALYRDEAIVRSEAGDRAGATQVLRNARMFSPEDPGLMQEVATQVLERMKGGEQVAAPEREEASGIFVALAEMYASTEPSYSLAFCLAALDVEPGHDRAIQLATYFARELGQLEAMPERWSGYLAANPGGLMVGEIRQEQAAMIPVSGPVGRPSAPPPPRNPSVRPAAAAVEVPESAESIDADALEDDKSKPARPSMDDAFEALGRADAASPEKLSKLLQAAGEMASKGNKAGAFGKYKEVLALDAGNAEALAWVKDHLRQKRLYAELRDVLVGASRAPSLSSETKQQTLRDLAALCEQQLRDPDGAIQALKQLVALDRSDPSAGESLRRLLEKAARWDELASVLEEEAMASTDTEEKLTLEKKLANLHEQKRKDVIAAAESWARIANLTPDDDQALWTAVKLFEKGERSDLAAQVIGDVVGQVDDKVTRGGLLVKLGELREASADHAGAGEAFAEAATLTENPRTWESAERAFVVAERWTDVAQALEARAEMTGDPRAQAALYARAAEMLFKVDDEAAAVARLEQAIELDPGSDEVARQLEERYAQSDRFVELAELLIRRSDSVSDREARVALRLRAAEVQRDRLDNMEAARETLLRVLEEGDHEGALALLIDDAEAREDYTEAASLLKRMAAAAQEPAQKLTAQLREARFLSERLEDYDAAIATYESILADIDPKNVEALSAIADLEERRENPGAAASALVRLVAATEGEEKINHARKLAELYEGPLDDPRGAMRALEVIVANDEEDFEAIQRLCALAEKSEEWERAVGLLRKLIEVEGDEEEISSLTRRLSHILDQKLGRGEEALAALAEPADAGDEICRDEYVELGDRLGLGEQVAQKLVSWHESRGPSIERNAALRAAFDRFVAAKRDADAAKIGMELVRSRYHDVELARELETIALRLPSIDALQTAHDLLLKDLTGVARAEELVRQAEVLASAGVEPAEAIQHGEGSLASVPAAEVDALLERLVALAATHADAIDIYERQVSRMKAPADRLRALARAAQIAAQRGVLDRARGFFELALGGNVNEETLNSLEDAARSADGEGRTEVRQLLAESLAAGGQGSRDGGRTRAALLRRSAQIAQHDLRDTERAFQWLGDALAAHVDASALDALEQLGREINDMGRVEATLSRVLGEVFDGPLVRQLLTRRAALRKNVLGDKNGAAVDYKKLHDLSPSDQGIMDELSALLAELGDHRGMVQVLEDQILRGKDPAVRAELARKVATIWEEQIGESREAADAWRRVLRMKPGDAEAQGGLDRAKNNMLRKPGEGPSAPAPTAGAAAPSASTPPAANRPASTPPPRSSFLPTAGTRPGSISARPGSIGPLSGSKPPTMPSTTPGSSAGSTGPSNPSSGSTGGGTPPTASAAPATTSAVPSPTSSSRPASSPGSASREAEPTVNRPLAVGLGLGAAAVAGAAAAAVTAPATPATAPSAPAAAPSTPAAAPSTGASTVEDLPTMDGIEALEEEHTEQAQDLSSTAAVPAAPPAEGSLEEEIDAVDDAELIEEIDELNLPHFVPDAAARGPSPIPSLTPQGGGSDDG